MMNPGGDAEMTRAVREAINTLAGEIAAEGGIDPALIVEAVIVCNPVMHHLLLGIDPVELGQAPFALATSDALTPARARARPARTECRRAGLSPAVHRGPCGRGCGGGRPVRGAG